MIFTTKCDLYQAVDQFRRENQIKHTNNFAAGCERRGWAKVVDVPFRTAGLRGMSYLAGDESENNLVLLRKSLLQAEKNFTCAHELIHIKFHNNFHIATFTCFDKIRPNQNTNLEWQANEGAAELIVPLAELLPTIKLNFPRLKTWQDFNAFKFGLARHFSVTDGVMTFRFEDLKYEIDQYLNDVPMERLEILSRRKQVVRGIQVKSLNDIENELWQKEFGNYHIDIAVS